MDKNKKNKFNSKVIHGGHGADQTSGAVMPPISLSSTFIFDYPTTAKLKEYISKELFDIRIENIDDNKELEPLIENEEISSLVVILTFFCNIIFPESNFAVT